MSSTTVEIQRSLVGLLLSRVFNEKFKRKGEQRLGSLIVKFGQLIMIANEILPELIDRITYYIAEIRASMVTSKYRQVSRLQLELNRESSLRSLTCMQHCKLLRKFHGCIHWKESIIR